MFEGVVKKIGWNSDFIVCYVQKQYRGDKDDWYALCVTDRKITGPFSEQELRHDASFKTLVFLDA